MNNQRVVTIRIQILTTKKEKMEIQKVHKVVQHNLDPDTTNHAICTFLKVRPGRRREVAGELAWWSTCKVAA